jgi:cytoskeletal protein RodZ
VRSTRSWFPLLGWCAATLTSVALASVAMLPVLRTATSDEGTLVSVDQLRGTGEVTPTPQPAVTTPSKAPSAIPKKSHTPSRTKATKSPKASATATATTPPPVTTKPPATTTEDGWTVTTDGDGVRTYVRSFRVDGGQTVIRASDGVIKLATATPTDGYSVATVQNSADNLAVYFNETNHSFIVHVVWQAGKPVAQVDEVGS